MNVRRRKICFLSLQRWDYKREGLTERDPLKCEVMQMSSGWKPFAKSTPLRVRERSHRCRSQEPPCFHSEAYAPSLPPSSSFNHHPSRPVFAGTLKSKECKVYSHICNYNY